MSSKRAEARSIASQLVLLFTLAAALLLCSGLGILYFIVVQHAFEEDNEALADKIFAVRGDLEGENGVQFLSQELRQARAGERVVYSVRVLDGSGAVIAQTPGMDDLLPRAVFPSPTASAMPTPTNYRTRGRLFSLATTTAGTDAHYVIEAAQDRSEDDEFSRTFRALLAGVLICGVFASAFIARVFTKRSLRPLAQMTHSFERIGPEHLAERVTPAGWPRELQPLALAYDAMLDRLEDSFTRLSQFSADLAHELRTPIANLRGEAEVALTRLRTPAEYREVIESNVGECERLSSIIDNLLFLARAEAAEGSISREHFDGRAALEKIISYYQAMAEERRVTIGCAGDAEIYADPLLFSRAISNLVDNALRHTPEGGRIEVSLGMSNGETWVAVRDNGSGMEAEHLPKVFDRFYRVDSSRSSSGTGLGLSLVKSITAMHGGIPELQSAPGSGTTVTLRFPRGGAGVPRIP